LLSCISKETEGEVTKVDPSLTSSNESVFKIRVGVP